jgi:NIF3 (NGG1p interacting factor 3)
MVAKAASRWELQEEGDSSSGTPLADVQQALDRIAPLQHAASWDNVGLLVGAPQQRVRWHSVLSIPCSVLP